MPILNYTTSIQTEKTVSQIQALLSGAGAKAIITEYDDDQILSSIGFQLVIQGQTLSFRLPARIDKIHILLQNDSLVPNKLRTREQAARVCWRIIKDWIEAQIALTEAEQAQLTEVFLPYAQDSTGATLYEKLELKGFAGLIGYEGPQ